MLAGLALFYVGAVLCLNGLWLLGRMDGKRPRRTLKVQMDFS